ncbi:hypothetical protein Tco_1399837 [Tanacetum coccineum]
MINKLKKKDSSKGEEIKQESKVEVKEEDKGEENTRKRKHKNEELRLCLTIAPDEDKEVDYEILDKKFQSLTGRLRILAPNHSLMNLKDQKRLNMNVLCSINEQDEFWNSQHELESSQLEAATVPHGYTHDDRMKYSLHMPK